MFLTKIVNTSLIYTIKIIRPLLGPSNCLYTVSCTEFAYQQLKTEPTIKAVIIITKRVMRCGPWFTGQTE